MPFLLVALFILVPIAELAVIIQVGQAIGVWWTIALLIADSILGAMLMRSQGRIAWRRFNEARRRRPRARARGRRRRARDLRRRAAAHAGLHLRHLRAAVPAAADARGDPARVPAPGDEAHHGLDGRRPGAPRTGAARTTSRAPRSTSTRGPAAAPGSRRERRSAPPTRRSATPPPTASRSRSATPGRSSTGSRGSGSRAATTARGRAARSRCCSRAASRSPRSPRARSP